jgi:hypothetical protein
MKYRRSRSRPELIVDQMGVALIDPDGNYIGWDGPILLDGTNFSTQQAKRGLIATKTEDTRGL